MRRTKTRLPLGVTVLDPVGLELTEDDRRRMTHPAVGGVILFAHNYQDPAQLAALTEEIASLREPELFISVDHEGGRVQRFKSGFTTIPPMQRLGVLWDRDRDRALSCAHDVGYVIAAELAAHGVDFSFAPVLDIDYGSSEVIGHRAFHYDPNAVGALAAALVKGLASAGSAAVAKHFPGHGYAAVDSHVGVPRDERKGAEILRKDVAPYAPVIAAGLAGVMPAHVIYPSVDPDPAGYSRYWLQDVLRGQLGFEGLIFSDDLAMEGASTAGGIPERAQAALAAGCDMVLLCQNLEGQDSLLAALGEAPMAVPARADRMRHRGGRDLRKSVAYREALQSIERIP